MTSIPQPPRARQRKRKAGVNEPEWLTRKKAWRALRKADGLDPSERLVLFVIRDHEPDVWISQATIAGESSLNLSTVERVIERLVSGGWLDVDRRAMPCSYGGATNVYRVNHEKAVALYRVRSPHGEGNEGATEAGRSPHHEGRRSPHGEGRRSPHGEGQSNKREDPSSLRSEGSSLEEASKSDRGEAAPPAPRLPLRDPDPSPTATGDGARTVHASVRVKPTRTSPPRPTNARRQRPVTEDRDPAAGDLLPDLIPSPKDLLIDDMRRLLTPTFFADLFSTPIEPGDRQPEQPRTGGDLVALYFAWFCSAYRCPAADLLDPATYRAAATVAGHAIKNYGLDVVFDAVSSKMKRAKKAWATTPKGRRDENERIGWKLVFSNRFLDGCLLDARQRQAERAERSPRREEHKANLSSPPPAPGSDPVSDVRPVVRGQAFPGWTTALAAAG